MSTYTPIASITLTAATSSITFAGIPQTYTDLVLVINGGFAGNEDVAMRFNSDTGSNYSGTCFQGNGSGAFTGRQSNQTSCFITSGGYFTNALQSNAIIQIQNYSNTTTNKTVLSRNNNTSTSAEAVVNLWRSTSAVTSINLFGRNTSTNWLSGTTFNLYGIGASLSAQAKATGGNTIISDGTYWYHVFNSSGTFIPSQSITADILTIAGGGGGGYYTWTAGGGAGGLVYSASQSLSKSTSYTVTVGAGGATTRGFLDGWPNGSNSQFGSLTAAVGGGGGGSRKTGYSVGNSGGSGGGAAADSVNRSGGSPTSGQGNAGGNSTTSYNAMAGGGGAGAAGGTPNSIVGGAGGAGSSAYSSWGIATNTGHNVSGTRWFAGGGGGGGGFNPNGAGGAGGNGGGGAGSASASDAGVGDSGLPNTGGGGGGGGNGNTNGISGSGGSGIVIVRYVV